MVKSIDRLGRGLTGTLNSRQAKAWTETYTFSSKNFSKALISPKFMPIRGIE